MLENKRILYKEFWQKFRSEKIFDTSGLNKEEGVGKNKCMVIKFL